MELSTQLSCSKTYLCTCIFAYASRKKNSITIRYTHLLKHMSHIHAKPYLHSWLKVYVYKDQYISSFTSLTYSLRIAEVGEPHWHTHWWYTNYHRYYKHAFMPYYYHNHGYDIHFYYPHYIYKLHKLDVLTNKVSSKNWSCLKYRSFLL